VSRSRPAQPHARRPACTCGNMPSPKGRRSSSDRMGGKQRRTSNESQKGKLPEPSRGHTNKYANPRAEAQWKVSQKWAPPRPLNEAELANARKLFFELDRDQSGAIDADELGVMMRALGQDPTHDELVELIASVDDPGADGDGLIQMREFFTLYARGVDSKGKAGNVEVDNCFLAMGGDPKKKDSGVTSDAVHQQLLDDFGLDVDLTYTFGVATGDLSKDDFKIMCGVE